MVTIEIMQGEAVLAEISTGNLNHLFGKEDVRTLDVSTFDTAHHEDEQLVTARYVTERYFVNYNDLRAVSDSASSMQIL